ncbi:unnamed protein product [Arabidopsis halleri]
MVKNQDHQCDLPTCHFYWLFFNLIVLDPFKTRL